MSPKFVHLALVAIIVHSLVSSVEPCSKKVVKEVFDRINSYKGHKYSIYGAELCQNSMILECKENELKRVDMVDMEFADFLPLEKKSFLLNLGELAAKPPQKPANPIKVADTVLVTGEPSNKNDPHQITGTIKIIKNDDPKEYTAKFNTTTAKTTFRMQITCDLPTPDKLDTLYVQLSRTTWRLEPFTDCTADQTTCNDVFRIVSTKITNSFTNGLKNLIERLGVTGKPELRPGDIF